MPNEGYMFGVNPQTGKYDPNYDPVLEARRAQGRANPTSVLDPIIHPLSPGGFLSPAPARPPQPMSEAPLQVGAQLPVPDAVSDLPGGGWNQAAADASQAPPFMLGEGLPAEDEKQPMSIPVPRDTYSAQGGSISVDRSKGLSGQEWLDSQQDPTPSGYEPPADLSAGLLFSGSGTVADQMGRENVANLFTAHAARDAARRQSETLATDPFAEQRVKGQYDVAKAVNPALIGANADLEVAKLRGEADLGVAKQQGTNATTREEAQYASYDRLVAEQAADDIEKMYADAQRTGASEQLQQAALAKILQKAQAAKLRIREFGVGGRPNPLEAIYGDPTIAKKVLPKPDGG